MTTPARQRPNRLDATRLPRLESLTGLRWWAAFFVFTHHMGQFAPLPVRDLFRVGTSGVAFFFVLSGFVLTWSAFPGDTAGRFYWRRFARIWPLSFLTALAAIAVFYPHYKPWNVLAIVASVLLLQAWSYDPDIFYAGNPASWSLSVEAFFYAIFPLLSRPALRAGRRVLLVSAAVTVVAMLVVRWAQLRAPLGLAGDIPYPVLRAFEFVLGVLLAAAIRAGWRVRVPVWAALLALGAAIVAVAAVRMPAWLPGPSDLENAQNQVLAPLYALLIVAVASRDLDGGRSWLRSRPLVALGQWSYAFYLIHATLIYAGRLLLGPRGIGWDNLRWYVAMGVLAVICSWLLYRLVEHPLERRMRLMLPPARSPVVDVRRATPERVPAAAVPSPAAPEA